MTALTHPFKDTLHARLRREAGFRNALLAEAVGVLLEGDVPTGRGLLQDYIEAVVGFETLARMTGRPEAHLVAIFDGAGDTPADILFEVIGELQRAAGVTLEVSAA